MNAAIKEAQEFSAARGYKVSVYRVGVGQYVISACEVEGGVKIW